MAELTMDSPFYNHSPEQQYKKCIADIKECVLKVKDDFKEIKTPITDDNQPLHKLCAKLEYLLQLHFKASAGIFSGKRDYWNFFWDCLYSNKGLSDGLRFVKRMSEIKTSLGRGRAFIRFSLVHQRLAETLQNCATNEKAKRNYYDPASFWFFNSLVGDLVKCLYEFNDVQFDLASQDCDLDASWPSFARRQFNSWQPPSRTLSSSSLNSLQSMQSSTQRQGSDTRGSNNAMSATDSADLTSRIDELEHERAAMEIDLQDTEDKNIQLAKDFEELKKDLAETVEKLRELEEKKHELVLSNEKLQTRLELKEEQWSKSEELLSGRIRDGEYLRAQLEQQLQQRFSGDAEALNDLKTQLKQSESKCKQLEVDLYNMKREMDAKVKVDTVKNQLVDMQEKRILQQRNVNDALAKKLDVLANTDATANAHLVAALQSELHSRTDAYDRVIHKNKELTEMLHKLEEQSQKIANLAKTKVVKYSRENQELRRKLEELQEQQMSGGGNVGSQVAQLTKGLEAVLAREAAGASEGGGGEGMEGTLQEIKAVAVELMEELRNRKGAGELEEEKRSLIQQVANLKDANEQLELHSAATACQVTQKQLGEDGKDANDGLQATQTNQESEKDRTAGQQATNTSDAATDEQNTDSNSVPNINQDTVENDLEKPNWVQTETENSRLRQQLCQCQLEISSLQTEVARLKSAGLAAEEDEIEKIEQRIEQESNVVKTSQSDLVDLHKKLEEKEEKLQILQSEHEILQQQYEKDKKNKEGIISALATQHAQIKNLWTVFSGICNSEPVANEVPQLLDNLLQSNSIDEDSLQKLHKVLSSDSQQNERFVSDVSEKLRTKEHEKKEAEANVTKVEEDLKTTKDSLSLLEKEVGELKEQLDQKTQMHDAIKSELDETNAKLKTSETAFVESEERLQCTLSKLNDKEQNCAALQEELNNVKSKLGEKDKLFAEVKTKMKKTSAALEEKDKEFSLLEEDLRRTQNDLLQKQGELNKMNVSNEQLQKSLDERQSEVAELNTAHEAKVKELSVSTQEAASKDETVKKLKEEFDAVKKKSQKVLAGKEQEIEELRKEKETQEVKFVNLSEQKDQLLQKCEYLEKSLEESGEQTSRTSQQKLKKINQLELQIQNLEEHVQEMKDEKQVKEIELEVIKDKLMANEEELQQQTTCIQELQQKIEEKEEKVQETVTFLEERKQEIENSKREHQTLLEKVQQLAENINVRETDIQSLQEEVKTKTDSVSELQSEVKTKTDTISELQDELKKTRDVLEQKEEENKILQNETEKLKKLQTEQELTLTSDQSEMDELKMKVCQLEQTVESLNQTHEEELQTLQYQLSSEQLLHEKALQSSQVSEEMYAKVQQQCSQLEGDAAQKSSLLAEKIKDVESLQGKQNKLDKKLLHLEETLQSKEKLLLLKDEEISKKNETIDKERTQAKDAEANYMKLLEKQKEENSSLLEENEMLRKRVIKLLKEKDNLWKKSDQLEHEQKMNSSVTWADGSTVTNCTGCDVAFGLFCRQHHCRLCGQIFCHQCTNNWIQTSHSSKEERVCSACMKAYQERGDENDASFTRPDMPFSDSEESGPEEVIPQLRSPKWKQKTTDDDYREEEEDEDTAMPAEISVSLPGEDSTRLEEVAGSATSEDVSTTEREHRPDDKPPDQPSKDEQKDPPLLVTDSYTTVSDLITFEDFTKHDGAVTNDPATDLWVSAWHALVIPVKIDVQGVNLHWEFETHPKDINFGLSYVEGQGQALDQAETLIPLCKCNSHKKTIKGELTARQEGIYLIMFDNKYSKLTAKKLTYRLRLD